MALEKADIQRFEWLKIQVSRLGIRFPVAEIAAKTGFDQGNISSYLKGKKPISDNFVTSFRDAYGVEGPSADQGEPTTKEILKVLAEAFRSQTEILKSIESKMAQEETQTTLKNKVSTLENKLNEALAGIDTIVDQSDEILQKIQDPTSPKEAGKKNASLGGGSKRDGTVRGAVKRDKTNGGRT